MHVSGRWIIPALLYVIRGTVKFLKLKVMLSVVNFPCYVLA